MRGDRLKDLRQRRRLTQEQMASKLGVPRTTYAAYEQNHREPDDAMKIKIADFFDVTVDFLVGRKVNDDLTVAAHMDDNLTEEQKKNIHEFIEFQKARYRKEHQDKKD
ncbi:MAG: helix-turn-helix transcriptional regulator [Lentilactobacillus sunkii]|jgi:transcriptional regulator with XRE-family HTH domain|uniref:helix-turn-helix domain-containing protein n=1 Tax=Lentilactobacillus sunkii TaxID=481719 RepID=UPI002F356FF2